jgi:hypothetical protein
MRHGVVTGERILIWSSDTLAAFARAASQSSWPRSINAAVDG